MDIQVLYFVFSATAFLLGTVVGSFLNVCIYRLPRDLSVAKGRSHCPACNKTIGWYDNIPLVSWLLLGAKCRHCGAPISWQYPLVEGVTGVLFFLVFLRFGFLLATPMYMLLAAGLILVSFVDLTDWTVPNEVTLPGILVGLGASVLGMYYPDSGLHREAMCANIFEAMIGAAAGAAVLYGLDKVAVVLLKKRGMGLGDVKLLAMLGAFFGYKGALLILMLAAVIGSAAGGISLLIQKARGEEEPTHYLPFAPYLSAAGLVAMFYGDHIISLWFDFMTLPLSA